jgi:glycosyltransferase involved in cell wall biosynthesis
MIIALTSPYPSPGVAPTGGVEVATVRLAHALRDHGIAVTVVGLGTRAGGVSDVPVVPLDVGERWSELQDLRPLRRQLAQVLNRIEPDIVHAQGLVPAGYAAVCTALGRRPVVVTAHGNRRQDTLAAYGAIGGHARWLLGRRMARITTKRADAIVGVHPDPRQALPIMPARFEFIPTIVEERFFLATRRPPSAPRVLYCGGLRSIKGFDLLLDAWPRVIREQPDARLLAPGCRSALNARSRDLATTVDAPAWLGAAALAEAMQTASVVVLPSRFEVAPTAMSEAWAARVPVVATAVGGIPELAQGAATLVEPSPGALSAAIVSVLAAGDSGREMTQEGFRRAKRQRAERVAVAHRRLYESLLVER